MFRDFRMSLGMLAALSICACGGGGSVAPAALSPGPSSPSGAVVPRATRTYQLASAPGFYDLPSLDGFGGSLAFPGTAVPANTQLALTSALQAPAGAPDFSEAERRARATGTVNVYFYTTVRLSSTVTFPTLPGFTVTLPTTIKPQGLDFFYAISNPNPTNGAESQYRTQGPATVSGQTVTFAASSTSLTLQAGQPYVIVFYAISPIAPPPTPTPAPPDIFVAIPSLGVATYSANGDFAGSGIFAPVPVGVAVDAAGKLYVSGADGSITTYLPNGKQTTPTITGLNGPDGVAVDAAGKIYVVNAGSNIVTTYTPKGVQTTPTISTLPNPTGVAVDAAGKIYVVNDSPTGPSAVMTYNPNGSQTSPTINLSTCESDGIAVDKSGKIYVPDECNKIDTYTEDGLPTTPTITAGLIAPIGVAVDASGKIFVLNHGTDPGGLGVVTAYTASGSQTTPTIMTLSGPLGIAVR